MNGRLKTTIAVAAVALLAAAGGASVYAQGGPGGPGRHGFARGGPMGMPLRGLDLTEEQRAQVKAIMERHRSELQAAGQRLAAAQRKQQDAVTTPPVDEGLIRATAAELANLQADAAILRARIHSEVFQILTPEQQQKAQQLKAERQQRLQQRRQRMQERMQQRQQRQQQQQQQQQPAPPAL